MDDPRVPRHGQDTLPGLSRLLIAGLLTGVVDGLFATVQNLLGDAPPVRLWQSVASTVLGPASFEGGVRTALIGLLLHFGVAFGWSTVFFLLVRQSARLRQVLAKPSGIIKVAAVYGPFVWLVMSLVVIPLLVQRPPNITGRWWVQLIGHFPFVGIPIVAAIAWPLLRPRPHSPV